MAWRARSVVRRGIIDGSRWFSEISETWVGLSLPPASRAIAEAAWSPDARTRYCLRCGDSIGAGEATATGCSTCREKSIRTDQVVRLGAHEGVLREWIVAVKYQAWAEMGAQLGCVLGEQILAAGVVELEKTIVVPMPMPWQRRLYRGIDHAKVIAEAAARRLQVPLCCVLAKANGPPQVALDMAERKRAGGRRLRVRWRPGGWRLSGQHVVLIDDVRTTGTTLQAAARILRQLGAEMVVAGVLAVADDAARRTRAWQASLSRAGSEKDAQENQAEARLP